jgi:hypothetical protein
MFSRILLEPTVGCGPLGSPLSVIVRKHPIFQGFHDGSFRRRSPPFVQVGIRVGINPYSITLPDGLDLAGNMVTSGLGTRLRPFATVR